jgi:XTP/dITP diphosphohydrolase
MTKLLIATNNTHKLHEMMQIMGDVPFALTSLFEQGIVLEVEETGATYAENSVLKARAYARASGLLTLADDSGLEVAALGGQPGIRSARYAGTGGTSPQRIAKLLANLEGVPWERRQARFVSVMALATPAGDVRLFEGACAGVIALDCQGENGFGYDPVFFMPEYGATMAELDEAFKNRISHRARAGQLVAAFLRQPAALEAGLGHGIAESVERTPPLASA